MSYVHWLPIFYPNSVQGNAFLMRLTQMSSILCNSSRNLLKLDSTEEENSGQAGF